MGEAPLISKIWLLGRIGINKIQKHIFGKSFHTLSFEEIFFEGMRRIDLLLEIVKYRASLLSMFIALFMNFLLLEFYP
jgi:hypothetical protein